MNSRTLVRQLVCHKDSRGWVYEMLRAGEMGELPFGQTFVTAAYAGQSKGHHYHTRKVEWFCVVAGTGEMRLRDVSTGQESRIAMNAMEPVIVRVPTGAAHALYNTGHETLVAIVISSEIYNPHDADTYEFALS